MKQTLCMAAILFGLSGSAMAVNDGLFVEGTVHPNHKETQSSQHTVWIQKIADGSHTYELRMEDGWITAKVDGQQVPENQIKKDDNAVILLKDDGGVLYEFQIELTTDSKHDKHTQQRTVFVTEDGGEATIEIIRDKDKGETLYGTATVPKVMLGIYSDEPGESLRRQLGIKGRAILVDSVIKGLSADKAGIKDHDIIVSIDGSDGVSPKELTEILSQHNPGDEIKIVVIRDGQRMKIGTKLHAYDAKALGHVQLSRDDAGRWVAFGNTTENAHHAPRGNRLFFNSETQEKTHAKILDALRNQGIDEDQIAEIEANIMESLNENVWSGFGDDGAMRFELKRDGRAANVEQSKRQYLVESMQKKAEQAMRDAERMTMEFKDGQLLLKRHAEGLEGHLLELTERLHESVPEIEAQLEGRLGELEERLDELESVLDSRMERLTGLIEQLIDRLDEK